MIPPIEKKQIDTSETETDQKQKPLKSNVLNAVGEVAKIALKKLDSPEAWTGAAIVSFAGVVIAAGIGTVHSHQKDNNQESHLRAQLCCAFLFMIAMGLTLASSIQIVNSRERNTGTLLDKHKQGD